MLISILIAVGACQPPDDGGDGDEVAVQLHELQMLSTHNSYKRHIEEPLFDALREVLGDAADELDYGHRPLDEQLDHGVRHVELDVFVDDPGGGRYADPAVIDLLDLEPMDPEFSQPGLKALHAQEVDYRSSCPLLTSCLAAIRDWSTAHPDHLPVTIQIEAKDDEIPDPVDLGFVQPVPWTDDNFAQLETEIRSVFDDDHLITPSDVLGTAETLREAVRDGDGTDAGWPTLDEARGRVLFTLDNTGAKREMYRSQVPEVADRLIFVDARPPDDDAAIAVVNDPETGSDEIEALAAEGLLLRTRADAGTHQARSGDTGRRDAAWASGAHFVSTDYIEPDERFGTGYMVEVPGGGVARCNPVTASEDCDDDLLVE